MKYTNKHTLPYYAEAWLKSDDYDYEPGVISSTRLLAPPRQYALYQWHGDKLEIDISDLIASRYGTAIHDSVEKVKLPNCEQEIRLYHEIFLESEEEGKEGEWFKISGKFDIMADMDKPIQKMVDVKSTSVWSIIFNDKEEDYIKQLSVYKYLANKQPGNKYNVGKNAEIMMVFTNWDKQMSLKKEDYPNLRIAIKPITLWDDIKTEEYIKERLRLFKRAKDGKPEDLPDCTKEELWMKDDVWKVMTPGGVRSKKNCLSEEEGKSYILSKGLTNKAYLKLEKSYAKRCTYCLARKFCSQYNRLLEEKRIDPNDIQLELAK